MAKLPAFQFYPGDWMKDAELRRCSPAARGVWMDMLCLMFDCEPRGKLVAGGRPWLDEEIVCAVSGCNDVVRTCLAELLDKGVAHRDGSGAVYSRRLLRDEDLRHKRAAAGALGGKQKAKQTPSKPLANPQQLPEDEGGGEELRVRGGVGEIAERLIGLGASRKGAEKAAAGPGATLERLDEWLAVAERKHRVDDWVGFVIAQLAAGEKPPPDPNVKRKAEVEAERARGRALWRSLTAIPPERLAELIESAGARYKKRHPAFSTKNPPQPTADAVAMEPMWLGLVVNEWRLVEKGIA